MLASRSPSATTGLLVYILHTFHIFIMGKVRDFEFGGWVNHSMSQPADDKSSLKGAWSGSRDLFLNFTPL